MRLSWKKVLLIEQGIVKVLGWTCLEIISVEMTEWNNFLLTLHKCNLQKQLFADVLQKRCLKKFAIFTGKYLCWSLFLIELQVWRPTTLSEKRIRQRCFPVNIAKFFAVDINTVKQKSIKPELKFSAGSNQVVWQRR